MESQKQDGIQGWGCRCWWNLYSSST